MIKTRNHLSVCMAVGFLLAAGRTPVLPSTSGNGYTLSGTTYVAYESAPPSSPLLRKTSGEAGGSIDPWYKTPAILPGCTVAVAPASLAAHGFPEDVIIDNRLWTVSDQDGKFVIREIPETASDSFTVFAFKYTRFAQINLKTQSSEEVDIVLTTKFRCIPPGAPFEELEKKYFECLVRQDSLVRDFRQPYNAFMDMLWTIPVVSRQALPGSLKEGYVRIFLTGQAGYSGKQNLIDVKGRPIPALAPGEPHPGPGIYFLPPAKSSRDLFNHAR